MKEKDACIIGVGSKGKNVVAKACTVGSTKSKAL